MRLLMCGVNEEGTPGHDYCTTTTTITRPRQGLVLYKQRRKKREKGPNRVGTRQERKISSVRDGLSTPPTRIWADNDERRVHKTFKSLNRQQLGPDRKAGATVFFCGAPCSKTSSLCLLSSHLSFFSLSFRLPSFSHSRSPLPEQQRRNETWKREKRYGLMEEEEEFQLLTIKGTWSGCVYLVAYLRGCMYV